MYSIAHNNEENQCLCSNERTFSSGIVLLISEARNMLGIPPSSSI